MGRMGGGRRAAAHLVPMTTERRDAQQRQLASKYLLRRGSN